ncbi:tryptophan 2,3-dioxygenase family protein [Dactylosporangium sp. NPDC000555]|uniref:tryptophan 2,3-dioxygenase family protein n=1 Tax=Dactylosporangium sp. NPDC000555 TaxID=3154260 RepID=UPI00332A25F9
MTGLTYAGYIRVPELLQLQHARSRADRPLNHSCEHFFIVTHQSTELWLSQILIDLDEASAALADGRYADAVECLERSAVVLDVMATNLEALASMPPGRFATFRGDLGNASGAQSGQFAALDRRLGLRGSGDAPLLEALLEACDREGVTVEELLTPTAAPHSDLARIVLVMLDVSRKSWKWRVMHIELTAKMIGHQRSGTGGTSGTAWLAGRLSMPFGRLWDAVSTIQREAMAEPHAGQASREEPACPFARNNGHPATGRPRQFAARS